jgi:hypothetical protein
MMILLMLKGDLSRHKPPLRFGLFVRGDKFYWGQGEKGNISLHYFVQCLSCTLILYKTS